MPRLDKSFQQRQVQSVSNKQLSSVLFNVITTAFVSCNDFWMKPLGHLL